MVDPCYTVGCRLLSCVEGRQKVFVGRVLYLVVGSVLTEVANDYAVGLEFQRRACAGRRVAVGRVFTDATGGASDFACETCLRAGLPGIREPWRNELSVQGKWEDQLHNCRPVWNPGCCSLRLTSCN